MIRGKPRQLVKARPAESSAAAAAVALLVATILGLDDPAVITALAIVIGFIPTAVTWIVETVRHGRE